MANATRARLAAIWERRELRALASEGARRGAAQGGEWEPPADLPRHPDLLPLDIGIPDAGSLPRREMAAALSAVLAEPHDAALRYDLSRGYLPLREWLAHAYTRARGSAVDASWFQICGGSSSAIDLIARTLLDPGDVVFAESPTYLGTLRNFQGVLAEVRALPMDGEGLSVDALAEGVARCKREGRRVKLVYTVATFQNPTGRTLSAARRHALLELAAREGLWVLDDDAYGELHYGPRPDLPALSALSAGHGVITVGSFSKVLATGLRIGWVHARPELIALLQRMRFEMGQSSLAQHMIARLAHEGVLDEHLARVRVLYGAKLARIAGVLEQRAARHLRFERPEGGFYLWAELRAGLRAEDVWRAGHIEGVAVNAGHGFFAERAAERAEHLRIAFSWTPSDRLEEAALRLARACERATAGELGQGGAQRSPAAR